MSVPDCDTRPPKGQWAPGNYSNVCNVCLRRFIGDKRARSCADCAYAEVPEPVTPQPVDSDAVPGILERNSGHSEAKASDVQVGGSHYREFAIQPALFCHRNKLGFLESCAIKYLCRHKLKGQGRQDLLKARHYIDLLLEFDYPAEPASGP